MRAGKKGENARREARQGGQGGVPGVWGSLTEYEYKYFGFVRQQMAKELIPKTRE